MALSLVANIIHVPCWIDNAPSPFNQEPFIEVPAKSSEKRLQCIAQGATLPLALAAAKSAADAREQWSKTGSVVRLRVLQQVANIFERRRETLLLYLNLELGLGREDSEDAFNCSIGEMTWTSSRFATSAFSNRHIAGLGPKDSPVATTPTYVGALITSTGVQRDASNPPFRCDRVHRCRTTTGMLEQDPRSARRRAANC